VGVEEKEKEREKENGHYAPILKGARHDTPAVRGLEIARRPCDASQTGQ
jgi:hypothetical protein